MTLNRLGSPSQEHRPLTPYEKGQMLTHYPTVGPTEMASRLRRSVSSIKYHWAEIRPRKHVPSPPMSREEWVNRQYDDTVAA